MLAVAQGPRHASHLHLFGAENRIRIAESERPQRKGFRGGLVVQLGKLSKSVHGVFGTQILGLKFCRGEGGEAFPKLMERSRAESQARRLAVSSEFLK